MAILLQPEGQAVAISRFSFGASIKAEAMAQEESFRIGNHRSVKKHKQKRIPQRGLGVAQLEKIRLEEQQKTFPNSHSFPPIGLPSPSSSGSLAYSHSQDPVFSIPSLHPLSSSSPSPPPFPPTPFIPLSWFNSEQFIRNVENFGLPVPQLHDHNAFRKQPTLVNLSPTSSSGVNLQMEPPSNQIYTNSDTPWPQEDRVVGIKRPWSFLNDSSSSCIPEHSNKFEYGNSAVRDVCLLKTSQQISWKAPPEFDFRAKDNASLDGGFLTLGPLPSSSSSTSRSKQSSLVSAEFHDLYEYQTRPSQDALRGSNGDLMPILRFSAGERWTCNQVHHQHHLHCDLPQQYQYQTGDQFYSFLCPEQSARTTEPETQRDADGADEKAEKFSRCRMFIVNVQLNEATIERSIFLYEEESKMVLDYVLEYFVFGQASMYNLYCASDLKYKECLDCGGSLAVACPSSWIRRKTRRLLLFPSKSSLYSRDWLSYRELLHIFREKDELQALKESEGDLISKWVRVGETISAIYRIVHWEAYIEEKQEFGNGRR